MTIGAVVVVLLLIGGIFTVVYSKNSENKDAAAAVAPFVPSESNKDPSTKIPGIYAGKSTVAANGTLSFTEYKAALHVDSTQRVAYDRFLLVGGPHDAEWADCNGDVYTVAVRNENMCTLLEHGAGRIAYNPATIAAGDLDKLKAFVSGKTYIYLSPYPNLSSPISLQAWAHQLKVTSASDIRIKQFITALQQNQYIAPEPGGSCDQPGFAANPPPFDATPPGAGAIQMNGAGLTTDTQEGVANAKDTAARRSLGQRRCHLGGRTVQCCGNGYGEQGARNIHLEVVPSMTSPIPTPAPSTDRQSRALYQSNRGSAGGRPIDPDPLGIPRDGAGSRRGGTGHGAGRRDRRPRPRQSQRLVVELDQRRRQGSGGHRVCPRHGGAPQPRRADGPHRRAQLRSIRTCG